MNRLAFGALIFLVGVPFWGGWSTVAAKSDIEDPIVRAFLINVVTALVLLPSAWMRMRSGGLIGSQGFWILVLAGCLNFGGHYLFPKLQVMAGSQLSVYGPAIVGLSVVTNAIGGMFVLGEPITFQKITYTLVVLVGAIGLASS